MRAVIRLMLLVTALLGARAAAAPAITVSDVPSPAANGAHSPWLTTGPDGTIWLSWVEPGASDVATLRGARFDAPARRWGPARTIATGPAIGTEWDNPPQLTIDGNRRIFATWTDHRGAAFVRESTDGGQTWNTTSSWTGTARDVGKIALARLAGGGILAAWLDAEGGSDARANLCARLPASAEAARLAAPVSRRSHPAIAPFLDGGALVACRTWKADGTDEVRVVRLVDGCGTPAKTLAADEWRVASAPENGIALASDGSRVAAAWFTGADDDPRILVSYSPDAGGRWLMPLRVSQGRPGGHPGAVLLRDGTIIVCWLEADGSAWLRRINPDYSADDPARLAAPGTVPLAQLPQLALLRDYAGAKDSAELVVAYVTTGHRGPESVGRLATQHVLIPEGELVAAATTCGCAPTPEELRGFSIRGNVLRLDPAGGAAEVRHREVPGVFAAGTGWFAVTPEVRRTIEPGREFLGRIEYRDGRWWLFDLRVLALPP